MFYVFPFCTRVVDKFFRVQRYEKFLNCVTLSVKSYELRVKSFTLRD